MLVPAITLVPLAIAFFLGQLFASFDSNICYSDSIYHLRELSLSVLNSDNAAAKSRYAELVSGLPISGYETNCDSLRESVLQIERQINEAVRK